MVADSGRAAVHVTIAPDIDFYYSAERPLSSRNVFTSYQHNIIFAEISNIRDAQHDILINKKILAKPLIGGNSSLAENLLQY